MGNMQREEPSVVKKIQIDYIVPNTDRGLEDNRFTSIEELLTSAQARSSHDPYPPEGTLSIKQYHPLPSEPHISIPDPGDANGDGEVIHETSSSGMFPLDGPAAFEEADKLSFLADAIQTSQS
ncbi:hypothetical protein B0J13DRAFT_625688 [Dactylonectria estremocensis]|uniref:Uncharacterized protein n=1 Tax=Dactylonectria estremocensis TaxID=1079267 RepID=A0A9P9EBJ5_9HYPO|nr:hypothetical protein B0J13DRAFT_625688 [Dactylonectria estremocensis]